MIIKGAKKAACYTKIRNFSYNLARRLAWPLFLPAASSCHEALMVTQLDKAAMPLALMRDFAIRPHVSP